MPSLRMAAVGALLLSIVGCAHPQRASDAPGGSSAEPAARSAAALVEQGRAYADVGDSLRAQQYFAASLKLGSNENEVLPLFLRACVAEKNYRLAAEYAEGALARHPQNARLRFLTGTLYTSLGDVPRARERLEVAAKELPANADVQFAVGVFFRDDAADPVMADVYFRQYVALAPRGAHAEEARSSLMDRTPRVVRVAASRTSRKR